MKPKQIPDTHHFSFSQKARQNPILYRGTWGIRLLLSLGFIPTGVVKLLGMPFTNLGSSSPVGVFFDMLLSTGIYWQFLGLVQVLAGILVLFERTLALGSIVFTGIILNILFITIGIGFGNTIYIALLMVFACLWLCFWEWGKLSVLFYGLSPSNLDESSLSNTMELSKGEKIIYGIGYFSGLLILGMTRGMKLPMGTEFILAGIGLVCLMIALILGVRASANKN